LPFLHSDEFSQIKVAGKWEFFNKLLIGTPNYLNQSTAERLRSSRVSRRSARRS
jgi:hypothetical protein